MNDEQHVVVAGVSPGERREPMVRWAATEAVSRGARLRLVAAVPPHPVPDTYVRSGVADLPATAHCVLDRAGRYAVSACPGETLARLSYESALLVLGSRGRRRPTATLFGSVGRTLIHHSACPVVVARSRRS
ncbi:hypothetical protein BLA60_15110 [Actinophytocola xinjiangensis]|uniref:UspA domain-containing protein n=1 Tax=Actinophytocola xinjiangensis TaxID=485602 RepID=A0A7Z0WLW5_9PSEU|nr:universal stress protein [Actinophytocola xinjiangensis]OLF10515.1 hypothetical protein BLA60_15110 [Actinophytocola xinjiangensis]